VIGAALAGGGVKWNLAQGLGGGGGDNIQAGVHASTRLGPAYVFGAFAFANNWLSLSRTAAFGDLLAARFDAQSYGGRIEGGYRLSGLAVGLTPYAAFQGLALNTPRYGEVDQNLGGFGLAYGQRTASWNRSELGARIDRAFAVGWDISLALRGRLAWAHNWVSDPTLAASFQMLPGSAFTVVGAKPVKDSALVTGLAELRLTDGAFVGVRFDGDLAPRSQTYAGSAQLRYEW
jgi:outer membrane autotransporter protein